LRILHEPTKFAQRDVQTFLDPPAPRSTAGGQIGRTDRRPDNEGDWDHIFYLGGGFNMVQPIMASRRHCHDAPGVLSLNSFEKGLFRRTRGGWVVTSLGDEERRVAAWKREQYSWGLLEGN
jgi:hypothetical protein